MAQSCLWQAISSWQGMVLQDLQSWVSENPPLILELWHQVKDLLALLDRKGTMISTIKAPVHKFTKKNNIVLRPQPQTITFFQEFLFHMKGIDRAIQIFYLMFPL